MSGSRRWKETGDLSSPINLDERHERRGVTPHGYGMTASSMNSSLLKALDVLAVFSAREPSLGLAEVSRRLGIPKSTAHRILSTLAARGFIERVGDEDYALGTSIIALTQAVRVNVEVRDRVATVARSLAEHSRESIYVAIPDGLGVLYVYAIETSQRLTARTAVGDRAPFHCTGVGKACLAFMSVERRNELMQSMVFETSTPHTLVDREALEDDLALVRRRGFATDCQEHDLGTFCVAAPFFGANSQIAGAMSISGIDPEIVGSRCEALAERVIDAAGQVSGRLGYVAASASSLSLKNIYS